MSPRQMGHWESAAASAGPAWGVWLMPPSLAAQPLSPMASSMPDAMSCQERRAKCWSFSGRGGTRACSQPTAGCTGSRTAGGVASQSWPPPSCSGILDSGCPAPWPCSPRAAVGWGHLGMSSRSRSPVLQQRVSRKTRKRGHSHGLARGGVEGMPRSLKKETLPAPQGEASPHSSPLLLRARLPDALAA